MIDRRRFLLATSALAAGACRRGSAPRALGGHGRHGRHVHPGAALRRSPLHPDSLARFVDPLPVPPLLRPEAERTSPEGDGSMHPLYRVTMRAAELTVHRDVPPTRFWTYDGSVPGPTIETRSGRGLFVEWRSELPRRHFLPVDHTLCGAGADRPDVRAVVHVHGAKAPPESDGYPEDWITPGRSLLYHYPNRQDAATLWYHDHAMGIERLNQYAGLFGVFLVRDEVEDALALPRGAYEIPLVLFDRLLDARGQLVYPTSGNRDAPWVTEFYGDALLVNGKLFPYLDVEPRRYRFRVVNASNSRVYYLSLSDGSVFHQIGSDQGLLPAPVPLRSVTLAAAERADLLVDFSGAAGRRIVLQSQSFQLLELRVAARAVAASPDPLPAALRPVQRIPESAAVKTRTLTLDEYEDPKTHTMLMLLNATRWHQPVTERPVLDTVEIWRLVNLTEDTHPIHLHLVRFQILDRQLFDADEYKVTGKMILLGQPAPPPAEEAGWKDTVRAEPGTITRIIARFEGYAGRYLWHCHVLEHAANEMMRPFEVIPA
ncbi:MAG TPA: multicopper oxidase [Polyangiaceae bacterium]|nr:multicopper oxidase [Polyangiaceae bacterium]